jgi:hypothetical protein
MTTIIQAITDFIFVADVPKRADVIIIPGGSDPAPPEKAAELFAAGYAPAIIPTGGVSIKTGKFHGVKRKKEIYGGEYPTDCAFLSDVLLKNAVPPSAIWPEDTLSSIRRGAGYGRTLPLRKPVC